MLFIITGKVKNEFSEPRSFIKVKGNIFALSGKKNQFKLARSEVVHCGNVLSDIALSKLAMESIQQNLANPSGKNRSNVNVKPGKLVKFMLVFSDLPENMEEYTIEIAGSSPTNTK